MKHSNVCYIHDRKSGFKAVEKAKACKNEFGLDLFRHNGSVYEGRTGLRMLFESELSNLSTVIDEKGGLPKIIEIIESQISKNGESPRYTRPNERKQDIFPPNPVKENNVEYGQAIKAAEGSILNKQAILNTDIHGKSLIMQLFREHEIVVPLRTQGWIIKSLSDIYFNEKFEKWNYHYLRGSKDSKVFNGYLPLLVSAVHTKQQYEEMGNGEDSLDYSADIKNENEDDLEM